MSAPKAKSPFPTWRGVVGEVLVRWGLNWRIISARGMGGVVLMLDDGVGKMDIKKRILTRRVDLGACIVEIEGFVSALK